MKNVFIDTSSMRNKAFDFEGRTLRALRDLCQKGQARVLITSVTRRECEKHLADMCDQTIQRAAKVNVLLRNVGEKEIDLSNIKERMQERWNQFLKDVGAIEVPISTVDLDQIFENYFHVEPPFEQGKKHEFPDAIVANALNTWGEQEKENVVIVTGDGGFRDIKAPNIESIETIEKFISETNKEIEAANYERAEVAFKKALDPLEDEIENSLEGYFYDLPNEWFGEVADFIVEQVKIHTDAYYINVDQNDCVVDFDADIDFSASISFAKDSRVYRDSDTKDFVAVEQESVSVSKSFSTTFSAELQYDEDGHVAITKITGPREVSFEVELEELDGYEVTIEGNRH